MHAIFRADFPYSLLAGQAHIPLQSVALCSCAIEHADYRVSSEFKD